MSLVVIWRGHASVPRRFSKWDKLPLRMSDNEHTSPKISLAPFPLEEVGLEGDCSVTGVVVILGLGGE